MAVSKTLMNISADIVRLFHEPGIISRIHLSDYHGFQKGILPLDPLERIAPKYGVNPYSIQA